MRTLFLALGIMLAGCATDLGDPGDAELVNIALTKNQKKGQNIFNTATYNGNGRTCRSCHPSEAGESGTLSPADLQALFAANPNDVLFQHDGADVGSPGTFDRLLSEATFQITIPLPDNVSIVGSSARTVTLLRSVPTTMNIPALDPFLMWDGRDPTLEDQAEGAILAHSQSTFVSDNQLDAIADFQTTLFNRQNLRDFANGGPAPELPLGNTASEIRGRRFFTPDGPDSGCGWCHSGPMLNEVSPFGSEIPPPLPIGSRFITILVSELNRAGLPVYTFRFTNPDGSTTDVETPDPGRALITGDVADVNAFKIQTVWGVKDTAPYFHDSNAKDLDELMVFYDMAFSAFFELPPGEHFFSDQDKADIIAFVKLL
jgi:cytochrome c peroxidase